MTNVSLFSAAWQRQFLRCIALLALLATAPSALAEGLLPPSSLCVENQCVVTASPSQPPVSSRRSGVFLDTNIRHVRAVGTRPGTTSWTGNANWLEEEYESSGLRYVRDNAPAAFNSVKALLMMKIRLVDFYVNQNQAPANSVQAQDPNWSNYAWNGPAGDWIGQLLQSPSVVNGEAALGLLVADQASAQGRTHPAWLLNSEHSWVEDDRLHRTRLDIPASRQHIIDFYTALVRKYGNTELWGIVLGEYYWGDVNQHPAGFDRSAYMQGRASIWSAIAQAAPLDANGTRIAIYQTNPVFNFSVTSNQLTDHGIGVSQSDVRMFGYEGSVVTAQGKVPTMINGDSRLVQKGERVTWPAVAPRNPFGFSGGERVIPTPQHLAWFGSTQGVAPLTSVVLGLKSGTVQNKENYAEALRMFGDGGTLGGSYGSFPAN